MSKKKETYASISKKIRILLERQEQEKQRIASVMAEVLLTDRVTLRIGDFTDTELRKVMKGLSGYLEECIDQVENDRKDRYQTRSVQQGTEVPDDSSGNFRISDTAVVQ